MAGAKCSAFVLFLLLVCNLSEIYAETYLVGDELGWTNEVSMERWPNGKTFYAGDILEFKYDIHELNEFNVVVIDKEGFLSCSLTENATVYRSGDDKITLPYGQIYSICSYPENCQLGMKMSIFAKNRPPL